jgi:hypothetical protein
MARLVRLLLLAAAFTAVSASPASATRILGLPETMTTAHFQIHYSGFPLEGKPVLHQDAAELAGNLERAYATFTSGWGYPAPPSDGDAYIDVYVTDLSLLGALGLAFAETGANQTHGYLHIHDEAVRDPATAAHELFHLVQFGIWSPMEPWLLEGSAEWAGFRFLNFPATVDFGGPAPIPLAQTLGSPDMSLSCSGAACGLDEYERGGYSRWHFYQYLTERYGNGAVKSVFDKGKELNDAAIPAADLLGRSLMGNGSTLSDTFVDWTVANLSGSYQAGGLKGIQPTATSTTPTGTVTGALPVQTVAVNHLAARYLAFTRGIAGGSGPCYAATLNLTVSFPSGLGARPFFRWSAPESPAIPLSLAGSTATLSVPWDTCTWEERGVLVVQNPSTSADAALFTVSGSLTVDRSRLATATPPPKGTYDGPTVPALDAGAAPTIALYGPETLRVSKKKRLLRLVVFSSGSGRLEANVAGSALGLRTLRPGNNDLRFTLPKSLARTLASTRLLRVTSVATSGARGASLTRRLLVTK